MMELKSWSHFYDAIARGAKKHDLRKMDRKYFVGQSIRLKRYDNINGCYTGEEMVVEVTYITSVDTPCAFSSGGLAKDLCILSIEPVKNAKS